MSISTLFIKDLVLCGIHGSTGRERLDTQRLKLDIKINLDITQSQESDLLSDTYDYKDAIHIAGEIIENEHHVLIEKIASRIADRITEDQKIHSVEVEIQKIDASSNGIPGIVVTKKRTPMEMSHGLLDFDVTRIMSELEREGGVSFPILKDDYRKKLLAEAEIYQYEKQPEIVGPANVREQLSSVSTLKERSLFWRLKDDFQKIFDYKLKSLSRYPFETLLAFNEISLQLYEKGSIGITPHMDGLSRINLICVFILRGKARFSLCKDRAGSEPKDLATSPGNVIIMRAPGFMNSDYRPFHFLSDVAERRIVFGLRQKK